MKLWRVVLIQVRCGIAWETPGGVKWTVGWGNRSVTAHKRALPLGFGRASSSECGVAMRCSILYLQQTARTEAFSNKITGGRPKMEINFYLHISASGKRCATLSTPKLTSPTTVRFHRRKSRSCATAFIVFHLA